MPIYNYKCKKCDNLSSDVSPSFEARKKWVKCEIEGCKGRAYYTLFGQEVLGLVKDPAVPKTLSDSDTRKMAKDGQESLVRDTKEALKAESGASPYAKMTLTEKGVKEFGGRKMTDYEKRKADEARAMVVRDAAQSMSEEQKKAVIKRAGTKQDSL
jgi:hypothetical protein